MPERTDHHITKVLISANRILLGIIFIYASWDKALEPASFAQVIANYQILPAELVSPAAVFLPWLELISGICLIINRWSGGSALIITVLIVIFMGAIAYNIYRGIDVACGCFTLNNQAPQNMWLYLLRDAVFGAMSIGALYCAQKNHTQSITV
jgi:uncharacterized membrane protein YphA (DoxX/SURF4 family)